MYSQTPNRAPHRNRIQPAPALQPLPQIQHQSGRWLLPLRLFLGITFIYAGLQKLTDPQYFDPTKPNYIGKQILGFSHGSPLHDLLIKLIPHAALFGGLIAYGELAIGLGTLVAILFRPAAFFGLLLSLIFFLTASFHVYPYFYGADIVFCFAWLTLLLAGPLRSGLAAGDTWWVPRALQRMPQDLLPLAASLSSFFLGVGLPETVPDRPSGQMTRQHQHAYTTQMQRRTSRRNFLWGALTGGMATIGFVLISQLFRSGDEGTQTVNPGNSSGATATTTTSPAQPTTTGGSTGATIGNLHNLPNNSAADFTIPGNGDPGLLVRLNNGKCVAFDATCTHAGCPVNFDPASGHLLCPCHGAEFDPAQNAAVVQGPANTPLMNVPIKIDQASGNITLQQ